jgi:hypothetical protein
MFNFHCVILKVGNHIYSELLLMAALSGTN